MKERPILFSGEMVKAILEGCKVQTRRVVKMTKDEPLTDVCWGYTAFTPENHISFRGLHANGTYGESFVRCPYGKVGDRLWVREAFWPAYRRTETNNGCVYRADYQAPAKIGLNPQLFHSARWTPSIHMPRWASRITLEVTGVRVERLIGISAWDAVAEGMEARCDPDQRGAVEQFEQLWEKINGKKHPWKSNPWVWVIEFRRVDQ